MYVTDTHPLVFYTANQSKKLSKKALQIFEECERGNLVIYIPAAVLWEYSVLVKTGKIILEEDQTFEAWCQRVVRVPSFVYLPLEVDHIKQAHNYNFHKDPFDLLIVATAKILNMPLITKDSIITDANIVEVIW